ncbi:pyridine nucleotide-disulfide oxidoreductase domain-containing protein 1 [Orussus abietinus]|uniref:pyridine nucleotide-disulfide oxidoreductase domain-containing protein 1 n=1 Tax=Orussus abietinus TaxID=222816 RepID=UPI0006261784|nr:pyridine nucleotide-disulfide oxidoreductase domain-containing protein 1 [Orussus abietinus]
MDSKAIEVTFMIVGGGIAGVSCAEGLAFLVPEEKVILISDSALLKAVTNIIPLGKTLMQFDVEERSSESFKETYPSISVIHDVVMKINCAEKLVETKGGIQISYKKLCLCTGAKPKVIAENNPYVIGIRDTESVEHFSERIRNSKRIIVVGNGGIATEIVHEVEDVEVIWVIKDDHISATFVDPGAAEFFQDKLIKKDSYDHHAQSSPVKRMKYTITNGTVTKGGPALGPDWHNSFEMKGVSTVSTKVNIEYCCEISKVLYPNELSEEERTEQWPIYAKLTNGKVIGCDFIVSATGVIPHSQLTGLQTLKKAEDGGILVDWKLETSEKNIFAAGDVCTANWELAEHWFQMRLWTQAQQMGRYAAKAMVSTLRDEEFLQDFCFELFTHVTKFFGYKVVLLGLYNGQKLDRNYEILLRMTKGKEYIKLILKNGKMQGAVLIGDTDLEEMCENLILNQLDLSSYGEDLLNPDIDIEDYFD